MPHARKRGFVREHVAASVSADRFEIRALSLKDVVRLTSLSRAHIYQLISAGCFPIPAKIGRRSVWHGHEVAEWIEARFAERGQQ
jgi:prophage regulatory protein